MGIVRSTINIEDLPRLREEAEARLAAIKDNEIDYSDIPPMTPELRERMRRDFREGKTQEFTRKYLEKKRKMEEKKKKRMFSLRVQEKTIKWWKDTVGEGYTGIMAKLLDEATRHPEWIKKCL